MEADRPNKYVRRVDSRAIPAADTSVRKCGCVMHALCIICLTKPCKFEVNGLVRESWHGYQLLIPCSADRVLWIENEWLTPTMVNANVQVQINLLTDIQLTELREILAGHHARRRLRNIPRLDSDRWQMGE